jgi:uncharacterized protein (TIGR00369 family)
MMPLTLPPYAEFLGVVAERGEDGALRFRLPFADTVVGRPGFLHGGAISGLLELAAVGTVMDALRDDPAASVKPINVTVDFMRGGRPRETIAAATVTRLGTRIANVVATAWQDDPDKPIASARMNLLIRRDGGTVSQEG